MLVQEERNLWGDFLFRSCRHEGGRLYVAIHILRRKTRRHSCEKVKLENMARGAKLDQPFEVMLGARIALLHKSNA